MVTRAEILNTFKPEDLVLLEGGNIQIKPTLANANLLKSITSTGGSTRTGRNTFSNQASQFLAQSIQKTNNGT